MLSSRSELSDHSNICVSYYLYLSDKFRSPTHYTPTTFFLHIREATFQYIYNIKLISSD